MTAPFEKAGRRKDGALLTEKNDSTLLAITPSKLKSGDAGLVWITLTSGQFLAAKAPAAQLASEIARIRPSEILVADGQREAIGNGATASWNGRISCCTGSI